jgi:predicted nucleic acid-binding protein
VNGFLLDTNVLSEYTKPKPELKVHAWLNSRSNDLLYISVLTLGEIQRGIAKLPLSARRTGLQDWLDGDLRSRFQGHILVVDNAIANQWGKIMGRADVSGKPLPIVDSLLAATALHHGLTLVTRDTGDLAATGVQLLNPWKE